LIFPEAENVPNVLIDFRVLRVKANFVGVSDELVGRFATEPLITQGRRKLAHIRGTETTTSIGPCEVFVALARAMGFPFRMVWVIPGLYTDEGGFSAMQQVLAVDPRPDGVVCYNDPVAAGALRAALMSGLRIPEGIAVIGSGNVHYSDSCACRSPRLISIVLAWAIARRTCCCNSFVRTQRRSSSGFIGADSGLPANLPAGCRFFSEGGLRIPAASAHFAR
jgi:DNA-binding LacI/PurR family transcriptional regulator